MLLADSTGKKYSPTVVAKTKPSTILEVAFENILVMQGFGRVVWKRIRAIQAETGYKIYGNATGWRNEYSHRDFLVEHFDNRADMTKPTLLLLDEFSAHLTDPVTATAARLNVHLMAVPPGLTSVCQPAAVSWMQPFKHYTRGQWVDYLRNAVTTRVPDLPFKLQPRRIEHVVQWVKGAWEKLTPGTIQTGYQRTGIQDASPVVEQLQQLRQIDEGFGEVSSDVEFDD